MTLTIPLSRIYPPWKLSFVPSAFEATERGIQRERDRLHGCPFIVVEFLYEIDYDNARGSLTVHEGFATLEPAAECARSRARACLQANENEGWRVAGAVTAAVDERVDTATVQRRFAERFRLETGSYFDRKYCEFQVLEVSDPDVIGSDLFAYLGDEYLIVDYLKRRGA